MPMPVRPLLAMLALSAATALAPGERVLYLLPVGEPR